MFFAPGGIQRLVSVDPVVRKLDGSRFTVSGKALKELFDVLYGRSSQSSLLPITELKDFFTRSWWTRMWVLQEVTFSRDTHFICGAQRLSGTRCNAFIQMYAAL
jgi:hypothetical protein